MQPNKRFFALTVLIIWSLTCLWSATPLQAYIDLAPTLAKISKDSKKISLIEIVDYNRDNHTIVFKEIRAFKGEISTEQCQHDVAAPGSTAVPRQILQWASPGAKGVLFVSGSTALICLDQGWYQAKKSGNELWKLGKERPDLPLAYYGSVSRLTESLDLILAGKDTIITVVAHGANSQGASFELALNRHNLPGLVKVQRIRANQNMPGMVMAASANPANIVGPGPVDENDLASLIEKLKSSDADVRTASADDVRWLGRKAAPAAPTLKTLLQDSDEGVRLSAAAALLNVDKKDNPALDVLSKGLESDKMAVRRKAAKQTGLAGPAAGVLTGKLAALLDDSDASIRITALEAIAMLGPAAAEAVPAVTKLLDNPELSIDAADALGRIGSAARSALKQLTPMLSAEQIDVQWAAVRAMSQIGGEDAHPAVEYLIKVMPKATEAEGYNAMIYFSLLGPVAKDAIPVIKNTRIKNPMLPSLTLWAIESDKGFIWNSGGMFGGRAGGDNADFAQLIRESYVLELGERLKPSAVSLAKKIMDGTAGDFPALGYKVLACGGDAVLDILTPYLTSDDLVMRERAVVALGNMGQIAAPAKEQIAAALSKSSTPQEKRLIEWCLKEIESD